MKSSLNTYGQYLKSVSFLYQNVIISRIFALTEPEMHTIRTALGSFSLKTIHLPCLSLKHTWGVFSFYAYE